MEIQRESTPMPEDDDMEIITIYIGREIMEQVQDSPGSANVPLPDSVDEKVGDAESSTSIMSEELNVASSQLTDSILDTLTDTFDERKEIVKFTRSIWMPNPKPACEKILVEPNMNTRDQIISKTTVKEQPAEAPAEKPICIKMKKKKDQILGFFRRSWQRVKRIFNKRSNKVSPL